MKTADQLRNDSAQAYDNFKAVAANIAGVNGVIARLAPVANQRAQLGLYNAIVNLDGADIASGNVTLFQQLLSDTLSGMGFTVEFENGLNSSNVLVSWDNSDDDS